ncbi:MAG TPA: hypothetical protein PKY81_03760 [bacterium]|nr:hypothetical protein [bacterium]HPN30052.1 hypothetical protein [bacterium]
MKKYLIALFFIAIINFVLISCGSKKAFYAPYLKEPKEILPAVNKKTDGKLKYAEYKKSLKLFEGEWNLYSKIRDNLSARNFSVLDANCESFFKYHNDAKTIINYDEYYYGVIYYRAKSFVYRYEFEKAIEKLNEIPEKSEFYNKSLELVKNLMTDSDDDGYIDEWEIIEGFNPANPYSHP